MNPDLVNGGMSTDVSKAFTNAFANGWTLTGSGEPPTAAIGSAVERVLRRDGCPHPHRADEPGQRAVQRLAAAGAI